MLRGLKKAIVLLLVAPALAWGGPSAELRGIDIVAVEGGARVSLNTSAITSHSFFTLEDPNRVVVDLRDTQLARGVHASEVSGVVANVRTGERPGGTLRVVIELSAPTRARGQWFASSGNASNQFVVALGANVLPMMNAGPALAGVSAVPATGAGAAAKSGATLATAATTAPAVNTPAVPMANVPAKSASTTTSAMNVPARANPPPPASVAVAPAAPYSSGRSSSKATPVVIAPRSVLPAHAPLENDRDIIVAVDAGHGGLDPGAIGRNGTQEKDVTLAIARSLAARINAEPGMRATLIRNGDYFVVLRDRMIKARAAKADLFVSIHADSIRDRSITGASVYVLSDRGASSEAARWLAERENRADLMGGVKLDDKEQSLASVLLDLSQTASLSASMTAAERVLAELDRSIDVRKSRVQQAGLLVLKSPDIPSMLVETGYISNPQEEARLKSDKHQERLADTIFTGLRGYFEVSPPAGTRLARTQRATLAGVMAAPATP